jgi:hypothetical protein
MEKNPKSKDINWFIDKIFLQEVNSIINEYNFNFLGFGIIASGIEFLGACLDNESFYKKDRSRKRFDEAIIKLFVEKYHKYIGKKLANNLYDNLRCGMAHVVLPTKYIEFIIREEASQNGWINLQELHQGNKLVLISEDFYSDFSDACRKLKEMMDKGMTTKKLEDIVVIV